jgi:hypothetical protein
MTEQQSGGKSATGPYTKFYLRISLPLDRAAGVALPGMGYNEKAECWDLFTGRVAHAKVLSLERRIFNVLSGIVKFRKTAGIKEPFSGHLKAMMFMTEGTMMMGYTPSENFLRLLAASKITFGVSAYLTSGETKVEEPGTDT